MREELILANATGIHDDSTSELATGLAIASRRGFVDFVRAQDMDKCAHRRYPSSIDSKIGTIGFASIGKTVAKNLFSFTVDTMAFTRAGQLVETQLSSLARGEEFIHVVTRGL
jgi:phosphoglycerate dehydrogenase-like enzyme